MPDNNDLQLDLEEVLTVAPDDLSDEQRTFLEENKSNLTDEQATTFGIEKEPELPIEPEVRTVKKSAGVDNEPPADDGEVDPDDAKMIGKVIAKKLKPIEDQVRLQNERLQEQADQVEVDSFIRENPEYSKYRGKILTYMKHPAYSNIPAINIAKIVAGTDLMKLGAQKEREAQTNVGLSKGAGVSSRTPSGGTKNWSEASKEDFEAKKAEVLSRGRT